ncbi:ATP-dependent RNA helicase SrmB [termite gut metagenome]|uniref:ATP-dependent RNA helicase SrmB n=1 Tax=termite gut metagenome TaxID=433724 RepID=A0A5J4S4B7_9ZZZZ
MKNPINVFDSIKNNFILYVKTAFGTRYPQFEKEREELLNRDKIFARAPWVEPLPDYKSSGFSINEIPGVPNLNKDELTTFKALVGSGLVGNFKLHQHQYEMLQKAMEGNHCVITSGTGSGKTESFLLPLFAYLSKELNKWKGQPNTLNNTKWWSEAGYGPTRIVGNGNTTLSTIAQQRSNPQRPTAVRAMLIYPMNALVEDQLSRLRKALDSDIVRELLQTQYNNNRIYFGRYNSTSPTPGKLWKNTNGDIVPDKYKVNRLKKELKAIEENNAKVDDYLTHNSNNLKDSQKVDLLANFSRLDGAEMRTRFDMQITPPDIMITNFSMLSIMMMRDIENSIFEKTKNWLECEDLPESERKQERKERIFHIIIDELHLYRGGSGSETAYIIRMLLNRIGLAPDSDQLRILASSASLEGEEGKNFLKSFFGVERKEISIIEGTEIKPQGETQTPLKSLVAEFEKLGKDSATIEKQITIIENTDKLNYTNNGILENINLLNTVLKNQDNIRSSMYSAFNIDGRTRAVPAFINGDNDDTPEYVKSIAEVLFGTNQKQNRKAVKGFFFLLGLLEKSNIEHKFPRIRFHLFYRNIPGLWGELISDNEVQDRQIPVGEILNTPKISHNRHRTLELIYCENCGTLAFGGSRVEYNDENGNPITELLPVSPDIEGVPDTSSATIIEKRKYKDFSIFCPGIFGEDNERNLNIIEPEYSIPESNGKKLVWCNAWLNVSSGKIELQNPNNTISYIRGRWLQIADIRKDGNDNIININYSYRESDVKRIEALPHICPHCEADYSNPNKKRKTPFRGFRTGFGKVSQLLSKELFNALPQGDDTRKLVAFSDSREDAAKLAKNIEEEHYNALLKEVIIHNLTNDLKFDNDVITALDTNNESEKIILRNTNTARYNQLGQLRVNAIGEFATDEQKQELVAITTNIKKTTDFVDIVIREMLKFGLNPGGPYVSIKNFKPGNNEPYQPWHYFFDLISGSFDNTKSNWQYVKDKIVERIEQNIAGLIFGRLFYSFEASGLGYATVQNNDFLRQKANILRIKPDLLLLEICNSFMRIVGDSYKHNRTDYKPTLNDSYGRISSKRKEKRYIKAVATFICNDENDLGNAVFAILEDNNHRGGIIEINNLLVRVATRQTQYYKCPHCGTIHLHKSGGICVFCLNKLNQQPEITTVESLWDTNYLTASLNRDYQPFRLHTEELTGQTDDQLLRQRQFKNIFLNEEDKLIQQIDLLSVTTTLEVGVDIGALQAILLANMPPQRFNYQQRVGRTGRRGQMYSYSLTFARGRSHDEFYFENPLSITGDRPPQPFLCIDQERIFKRMLAKAILRFAFKHINVETRGNSVHGEFGSIENYNQIALQNLIDTDLIDTDLQNSDSTIKQIFNSLNIGIYSGGQLNKFHFTNFEEWIKSLPKIIFDHISTQNSTHGDLSELLAESGLLPMGGMPTRIRKLIHGFRKSNDENGGYDVQSIDRDLGIAIYEFAPGAQKTKDKGVIQAIGFTPDIQRIEETHNGKEITYAPKILQSDAFTERKWLIQDRATKCIKSEPYSNHAEEQAIKDNNPDCKVFVGAVPEAFRTDFKYPKDSNEDFEINLSKPLTFAETREIPETKEDANYKVKYAQQELTWKINNNGELLFNGQYVSHKKCGAIFNKQWIANDFIADFDTNGDNEKIALASSKITEVFRIEPQKLDFGLDINPYDSDLFKAASSKGAFYSAAFLLQRTLANNLDVDPEEIEIAAIDSIELFEQDGVNKRASASIVLSDELPNGSGFIQQLFNNIDSYIEKCINPKETDSYNYLIVSNQQCFDASYRDLKNYRNMNFHPLLDWRLAVGLLRVFADANYLSGLKDDDYNFPELQNWLNFAETLAQKMVNDFENIKHKQFSKLHGFCIADTYNVIITHPFWNYSTHQSSEDTNILTKAIAEAGLENLYFIDTFNLHRRPGLCYGEIIKKIVNG